MELQKAFENTDYSQSRPLISSILDNMVLVDFHRERSGKIQRFYFTFIYDERRYTLVHEFLYHWSGVDHWFRFKKSWLSPKPFHLHKDDLVLLSGELMKSVNRWNRENGR